jgi:outer membrane protein assembly factor BamE (lipoprotein component of BamABCDE complex)
MEFDAKKWADEAGIYKKPYPRQQMLSSVLKTLKAGLPKETVISMLGPRTKTDKFSNHGLVYLIGPEPSAISVDSQWLAIDFDQNDKIKNVQVLSD